MALLPSPLIPTWCENGFFGVFMTPEQVAGIHRWTASPEILVGWQSHLAVWCNFIAPRLVEKVY